MAAHHSGQDAIRGVQGSAAALSQLRQSCCAAGAAADDSKYVHKLPVRLQKHSRHLHLLLYPSSIACRHSQSFLHASHLPEHLGKLHTAAHTGPPALGFKCKAAACMQPPPGCLSAPSVHLHLLHMRTTACHPLKLLLAPADNAHQVHACKQLHGMAAGSQAAAWRPLATGGSWWKSPVSTSCSPPKGCALRRTCRATASSCSNSSPSIMDSCAPHARNSCQ